MSIKKTLEQQADDILNILKQHIPNLPKPDYMGRGVSHVTFYIKWFSGVHRALTITLSEELDYVKVSLTDISNIEHIEEIVPLFQTILCKQQADKPTLGKCKDCYYWKIDSTFSSRGICQRYPPSIPSNYSHTFESQPRTWEHHGCGEFESR